jgi:hypothetical protein
MKPCSPQGGRRTAPSMLLVAAVIGATALLPAGAQAKTASAAARYHQVDTAVVKAATKLAACQRSFGVAATPCAPRARSLQSAGLRLSALQTVRAHKASSPTLRARQKAPVIMITGQKLSWAKVADVTSYVLVRKVAGATDQYSVVTGTSTTPAPLAGKTVTYGLRTAVVGSAWAREAKISYTNDAARQAAPVVTVSGQKLSWTRIAGLDNYVMVTKVPGQLDHYEQVTGTTATPPAHPGATVRYSVRTDVDGSLWATEKTIAFPAGATVKPTPTPTPTPTAPTPTPTPTPTPAAGNTPAPPPATGGDADTTPPAPSTDATFHVGVVAGSALNWELPFVQQLGAKSARMEFDINTPAAQLASAVDAYAKAGVQPLLLAGFQGRSPTAAEAKNLGTWAAAYGPGGTFWQGKNYAPSTAVTDIEFGNESNQNWQYPTLASDPNWANTSYYANLATQYALGFKTAKAAITAANANVGLLAIGDTPGNWPTWMNNIYKAVPEFSSLVSGWVMHPYGPASRWQPIMDDALAQAKAHGASSAIPIFVTEYGIATDNGRCLDDNYGWDKCMTYSQAATALSSSIAGMRSRYGSRMRAVYLYQAHDQQNSGASTSRESYFGGETLGGAAKGAYTSTVESLLANG